ncbi:chromate efflux transporter [Roseibium aggregatum]|uniref:Chromate efflux transporter n=1 Tax=Roseibium aggregatum TaxID=187304 RepID=A0A939EHH2_9HYPH|nr:chromate efflux transporter [Roseibium aggregatum]MBN9672338.1 chromate efflux transporter [Roseibium aggregatum]
MQAPSPPSETVRQDGTSHSPRPSLGEVTRVSLKVGLLSFGGPAAQISVMHQEFVENRKWLTEDRFLHALNYCMLLPGPEAQQLATYCGWLSARALGGLVAGLLFILPGAFAMALVSYVYAAHGDTTIIASIFYGVKAGVLAIVVQALLKIGKKALTTQLACMICGLSFCALFFFSVPFPIVIFGAALAGLFFGDASGTLRNERDDATGKKASLAATARTLVIGVTVWALPPLAAVLFLAPGNVFAEIAEFFSLLAVVSFGGAYALLSYMAQVAVESKAWLSAGEMLDGLGLAETTPGPLILVTQFVGFLGGWREPAPFQPLTGALLAAAMTTWVTFAPSFLFILAGAPWMEKLRGNAKLARALSAITAAVAGTVLNLAIWFALHVLFAKTDTLTFGAFQLLWPDVFSLDPVLLGIALVAAILVFAARRGMATVLIATAALGFVAKML